jgi:hypothetical protein
MKPVRMIRELRLKDVEAFRLRKDFYGEILGYLLIADLGRPSRLADFPMLMGIEDEREFGRSNFMRAIILYDAPIDEAYQGEIVSLVGGLLENKDDCDWNATFEKVESQTFAEIAESRNAMLACFEGVLQRHGLDIRLTDIREDKFNHLSQD